MKRSIKIIIFTLMLTLALLPLSASAEVLSLGSENEVVAVVEDATSTEEGAIENPVDSGEAATGPEEEKGDTAIDENEANGSTTEEGNPFEALYSFATEHIGEIFSLLSFIAAAVVAFLYNKGLLPALKNSLSTMANILAGVKNATEKSESMSIETKKELLEKLGMAENGLVAVTNSISVLTERLEGLADSKEEQEKMRTIMSAQIDMLYEIFLCSSLPEYQKEAVREKVAAMKEVLCREKQENAN